MSLALPGRLSLFELPTRRYFNFLTSWSAPLAVSLAHEDESQALASTLTFAGPSESPGDDVDATATEKCEVGFVEQATTALPVAVRGALLPSCCETETTSVAFAVCEHVAVPVTTALPVCPSTIACGSKDSLSVSGGGAGVKFTDS